MTKIFLTGKDDLITRRPEADSLEIRGRLMSRLSERLTSRSADRSSTLNLKIFSKSRRLSISLKITSHLNFSNKSHSIFVNFKSPSSSGTILSVISKSWLLLNFIACGVAVHFTPSPTNLRFRTSRSVNSKLLILNRT